MGEVNYAWGSERPSARRTRLKSKIGEAQALRAAAALEYERKLAEIEAIEALRLADLNEVDLMTSGGTAPYNRDLEADPQVAGRQRVQNTRAIYGRGRELVRSTLPTEVIKAGETARNSREGMKATSRKGAGRPKTSRVAPVSRTEVAADAADQSVQSLVDVALQSDILVLEDMMTPAPEAAVVETQEPISVLQSQEVSPIVETAAFSAMGDVDAPDDDQVIQILTSTDKVLDLYSPAVLAERSSRRDPSRLPHGYDPTWADHWQVDPYHRLPEMVEEFPCFGAATDKAPELLTDDEAQVLIGSSVFRRPRNFDPKAVRGRLAPPIYSQLNDLDEAVWRQVISSGGGTLQKAVAAKDFYIDPMRQIERSRVRMWPLAVSRRNTIKTYMEALAAGEMTFEPSSNAAEDLKRSVRYRIFRDADYDWVGVSSLIDREIYYLRILDNLPWPVGLSRIELLDRFGIDLTHDVIQNTSPMGRPPKWLFPEVNWRRLKIGSADMFGDQSWTLIDANEHMVDEFSIYSGEVR